MFKYYLTLPANMSGYTFISICILFLIIIDVLHIAIAQEFSHQIYGDSSDSYIVAQSSLFMEEMKQLSQDHTSCHACQDLAWTIYTQIMMDRSADLSAVKRLSRKWIEQCAAKPKDLCSWYPIADMAFEGLDDAAGTEFVKELRRIR
jgi:hypothetical protein